MVLNQFHNIFNVQLYYIQSRSQLNQYHYNLHHYKRYKLCLRPMLFQVIFKILFLLGFNLNVVFLINININFLNELNKLNFLLNMLFLLIYYFGRAIIHMIQQLFLFNQNYFLILIINLFNHLLKFLLYLLFLLFFQIL